MNDALLDRERGGRFLRHTVADAGKHLAHQLRERTENRNGKDVAIGHLDQAFALQETRVAPYPREIEPPAQVALRGFVFEIEIGQLGKIHFLDRDFRGVMPIILGQRNVGAAGQVAGKQPAFQTEDLEAIVGEEQLSGDSIEGQHLVDKGVIHSTRGIDVDLEMRLLSRAELHHTVRHHVWSVVEAIRRDVFPETRFDPDDRFARLERRLHIR